MSSYVATVGGTSIKRPTGNQAIACEVPVVSKRYPEKVSVISRNTVGSPMTPAAIPEANPSAEKRKSPSNLWPPIHNAPFNVPNNPMFGIFW